MLTFPSCPYCQSPNSLIEQRCRVCGGFVVGSKPPTPHSSSNPNPTIPPNKTLKYSVRTCPSCQTVISVPNAASCSVCGVTLTSTPSHLSFSVSHSTNPILAVAGSPTNVATVTPARRVTSNYLEGIITAGPFALQDQPRSPEMLQILAIIILLIEISFIAYLISSFLFIGVILLLVFSQVVRRVTRGGLGCLGAIFWPWNLVRWMATQMMEALNPGRNPNNLRREREYHVDVTVGVADVFVVRGDVTPRLLREGDYVRVWIQQQAGRAYFQRGGLRTQDGTWQALTVMEPSVGFYWLIALVVLNLIGFGFYYTFLR